MVMISEIPLIILILTGVIIFLAYLGVGQFLEEIIGHMKSHVTLVKEDTLETNLLWPLYFLAFSVLLAFSLVAILIIICLILVVLLSGLFLAVCAVAVLITFLVLLAPFNGIDVLLAWTRKGKKYLSERNKEGREQDLKEEKEPVYGDE